MHQGRLVIGDLRNELGRDMLRVVESVILQKSKERDPYWLLIRAENAPGDPRKIVTKIIIMNQEPPKMFSCLCFKIDNVRGEVERPWVLPRDDPREDFEVSKEVSPDVAESAKDLWVAYG